MSVFIAPGVNSKSSRPENDELMGLTPHARRGRIGNPSYIGTLTLALSQGVRGLRAGGTTTPRGGQSP